MFNWLNKVPPAPEKSGKAPVVDASVEKPGKSAPLKESAAHKKRGNEFLAQGLPEEAAECYRQAIAFDPGHAEAYLNLGFVLLGRELYKEAETYLKQATHLNPRMEDAYYLLGTIAQEQGKLDSAIENFYRALEIKPDFEIVYRDLCRVLFQSGQHENAKETVKRGISLNPEFADFYYYLGNLYLYEQELEKAISCYQKALSIQPDYAGVHANMGKAHLELGNIGEAMDWYRKACLLDSSAESTSALLFAQNYNADCTPAQYLAEARHFGNRVMAQAKPYTHWAVNPKSGAIRPLRVGLVSGDFNNHPVGFFLESILAHLNPSQIELVAYPTQQKEDDLTARIKPRFAAWKPIVYLSDEAAARQIHEDGIHILIDLAGHTAHNRLAVFAWKPAPVQTSWLGYLASTGVPTMDFLLADRISAPEAHREHFTEKIWYLPDTVNCFTPPLLSAKLAITPPPILHNGHITFGAFQNIAKINDGVLALWGRIFQYLPQARLSIHCKQIDSESAREQFQKRLGCFGVPPERIALEGTIPSREDFLATYAKVDIILDSFPYPGITTTCEALWMGVPTLTLAGDTLLGRQGASLLTCVGLEDWIAQDKEEYVALAVKHATDVERLAQLRAGLRQRALASPLFDAPRFARNLENALQDMWQQSQQITLPENHV